MRLGYARVSSDEQADALPAQVARLEAAGCDRILSDVESGLNDARAGLLEAMVLIRTGEAQELLVTRVDRLGRDAAYVDQLMGLCEARGVTVRALDGGVIETATPQGFLMARLMTGLAEMESRMLSMRIRRQFEVYRGQGRHLRRRKPFGYMGGPNHRLMPHPENWGHALRVIEDLRRLRSFTRVTMELPSWCPWTPAASSLQGWFVNPVIRGHLAHHWDRSSGKGWQQRWGEIRYDQHPALISETDWRELADDLRRTRNRFDGKPQVESRHGLTGLLRCDNCGSRLRRNTSAGVAWWRCRHRLCTDRGGAKEGVILKEVVAQCLLAARGLAELVAAPPDVDPRVTAKQQDLEQIQALLKRNPANAALAAAVAATEQEIQQLLRREQVLPDLTVYEQALSDPQLFLEATAEEQRALFGAVLEEVRVGAGGSPIHALPRSW